MTVAHAAPNLSADQRAHDLLSAMTLDEKLTLVFGYFGTVADFNPTIPERAIPY